MQQCLYDGEWPKDGPLSIDTFCSCYCGGKIYFFGNRFIGIFRPDDLPQIVPVPCLMVFSPSEKKPKIYTIDEELPGEVVDMYTLREDLVGVIYSNTEHPRIHQLIWKLNEKSDIVECLFERKLSFAGVNSCRLGIGIVDTGYIQLVGNSSVETGAALHMKLIAANPLEIEKYPDKTFDAEVGKLEQLSRNHRNDLMIFPSSVPLINRDGMYMFLGRVTDNTLIFEMNILGRICKNKKGESVVDTVSTEGTEALKAVKDITGRDLNVGWCSFISQRSTTAWLSFIVVNKKDHWRYRLQYVAILFCSGLVRYIGKPLIWFSRIDGGFLAMLFVKCYFHFLGPSLMPSLGPQPELLLLALDLQNYQYRHVPFKDNERVYRTMESSIMIDATCDGSLEVTEVSPHKGRMRISYLRNPFKVQSLLKFAHDVSKQIYPAACANLLSVQYYGGCTIFS